MSARPIAALAAVALTLGAPAVVAQMEGDRGVVPVGSSGDYEIGGIGVDVAAKTADAARFAGWRLAQRRAWAKLVQQVGSGPTSLPDGTLDQIVSGIVIENEQIGPTRYIARLGVTFDRGRASAILGISAYADRSVPMLVIPLQYSGGVGQAFEGRSDWQQAWARFRAGGSTLDYVRPAGTGPDALLLNAGQIERRPRGWWRSILDQYGASDVLIPMVTLYRQWPGGPVIGVFQARHGPDNDLIGSFTLRVASSAGLPRLLDTGIQRLDALYQRALRASLLDPDTSLSPPPAPPPPAAEVKTDDSLDSMIADLAVTSGQGIAVSIQYDSPTASSVANVESLMRTIPGVHTAQTTSLALGGVSLMRVTYDGDPAVLRTAIQSRGFQVTGEGQSLRIRTTSGEGGGTGG